MTTPSRHDELLAKALEYAAHGLRIAPGHEPLFDNDGNLTGCTCEAYKRSKKYFEWLRSKGMEKRFDPNFKCRTPGKHPRLSDWETQASNDPAQIRAWWQKWPTANICFPPGINGFVTFDLDSYKEVYGDDGDLFTMADKQTATQISGGGGEHLIFKLPPDKAYTNANNTLKEQWPGIDIRCFGGQILVEPSLHPSGNLYQWEDGYSILECTPKPLPAALEALLDAAHQNSTKATHATFTTVTTEKPDLIRWRTSKAIRELINAPGIVGQRSENDAKVCTALLYAGATADDILAVFQHYPIGTQGRYADRGDQDLARTIGKAQAFVDAHPRPDITATIDNLLLWVRTTSFEPFINPVLFASDGTYRGDSPDTKTATVILCEMKDRQRLTINIGKKRLAKLAGFGSCNTAHKALTRLNGWLFDVTIDPQHGAQVVLDLSRLQQIDPLLASAIVFKRDHSSANDAPTPIVDEYSPRMAQEPFLVGTSKNLRERFEGIAQAFDITLKEAKEYPVFNEATGKEELTYAGFGESVLRVITTMRRAGDMTAQELADETGKKLSSIRTALRKLVQHGIVEGTRENAITPYTYSLCDDVWIKIDVIAPTLRTYKMTSYREDKRVKQAQRYAVNGYAQAKAQGDQEKENRIEHRFMKLADVRMGHLRRINPQMPDEQIEEKYRVYGMLHAYKYATVDPSDPELFKQNQRQPDARATVRTYRTTQSAEHRDTVRIIRELAHAAEHALVDSGLKRPTQRMIIKEIMQYGTFEESQVREVVGDPAQWRKYTPEARRSTRYAGAA